MMHFIFAENVFNFLPFVAVMSGERLMHMTRTYNDVGALTLLLEEVSRIYIVFIFITFSSFHLV